MPSFDFSSKVDLQTLDNAINTVSKEITNRFDFKGSPVVIELNKKEFKVNLQADSEMKLGQIRDVIISRSMKQGIPPEAFDFTKEPYQSGKVVKKEVLVKNGIKQEDAKIVGSLESMLGTGEITNGKVNGNKLVGTAKTQMQGQDIDLTINGTIDGDSMKDVINAEIPGFPPLHFEGNRTNSSE